MQLALNVKDCVAKTKFDNVYGLQKRLYHAATHGMVGGEPTPNQRLIDSDMSR